MEEKKQGGNAMLLLRRFGAFVIDFALWFALVYLVKFLMIDKGALVGGKLHFVIMLVLFVVPAIYSILMWYVFGATVGMFCFNLRLIETQTGKKPMLLISLLRYCGYFLSWFSFFIGFIWSCFDSRNQNFADKLSGTIVVPLKQMHSDIPKLTDIDISRWKAGKIFMIISILILIIVNILWQYEAPLSNEAEAALINYSPDENPEDNGFYLLSAFGVPEEVNAFEEGLRRTKGVNTKILSIIAPDSDINLTDQFSSLDPPIDTLATELEVLSDIDNGKLIESTLENEDLIKHYYNQYNYIQDRYFSLLNYNKFDNKLIPDMITPIPILMPMVIFERLYTANFVLEYVNGDRDYAIELMKKGENVCMHLMNTSDSLIFKLVSTILMAIHQRSVSELISYENPVDPRLLDYIDSMSDFTKESLSLRKPYMHEFNLATAFITRSLDSSESLKDYAISRQDIAKANPLFVKGNNIANHTYEELARSAEYSELSTDKMYELVNDRPKESYSLLEYIYNPIGIILSKNYSVYYNQYAIKIRDVQNRMYLLKTASYIKRNHLTDAQITEFLTKKQGYFYNHYTNKPLDWDKETGKLSFNGPYQEETKDSRFVKL